MLRAGGPAALTMSALADRLGVSVGGIYRYYSSKGAILVGLERRAIASFERVQADLLTTLEPTLRRCKPRVAALARIIAAAAAYPEHARRDPMQHQLMAQLLSVPEQLLDDGEAHDVEAEARPVLERSVWLLDAAAGAGALGPGDAIQRTFVLWAAVQGADQFHKRDRLLPPSLHSAALSTIAVETLLLGWGADPADLAAARASGRGA